MPDVEFRQAEPGDEATIRDLAASADLPFSDISLARQEFVLALTGDDPVGCVGLEPYGDAALLRSLAVVERKRNQGLGTALFRRVLARAAMRGVRTVYALTTTAERFCVREGLERVERASVPADVAGSAQFRALCPAAASCFRRRIDAEPLHFPADVLRPRQIGAGTSMWAVALDRAMLTYFEVEPGCRFDRHTHPSEQITMVLEGELVFEVDPQRMVTVRPGEVIAIPAGVPHAAWTRNARTKAVDAWSPVRADLLG